MSEWPYSNELGVCWCGHVQDDHNVVSVVGNGNCVQCQCVGYTEDKWVIK
jgi:hypothetical protein